MHFFPQIPKFQLSKIPVNQVLSSTEEGGPVGLRGLRREIHIGGSISKGD